MRIGQKKTFTPAGCYGEQSSFGGHDIPRKVTGKIVYINRAHRWYLVEAHVHERYTIRQGFKFDE